MAVITTLAACSTNPALNGPDGSDVPSTLDDAQRYALSFIALLRDGAALPTGMVTPFATATAPAGWLKLNGALVSRTTYAALFAFASTSGLVSEAAWTAGSWGAFSVGDGSTTFRLPDLRGMVLRGLDEARGIDTSRVFGSYQASQTLAHSHGVNDTTHTHALSDLGHNHGGVTGGVGDHVHAYNSSTDVPGAGAGIGATPVYQPTSAATVGAGAHSHTIPTQATGVSVVAAATGITTTTSTGSAEARVANVALPFYIKT